MGVVMGAIWGLIPAIFKAKWNVNETLFTLMMNYVAMQLVDYYYNILPVQRNIPRNLCGKWSQKTYTGREIKKDSIIIFR